jgi:hypothetical protein
MSRDNRVQGIQPDARYHPVFSSESLPTPANLNSPGRQPPHGSISGVMIFCGIGLLVSLTAMIFGWLPASAFIEFMLF